MRLVDADLLDRQRLVEEVVDAGAPHRRVQHPRRAVGEDRRPYAVVLEARQHVRDLGIGVELEIQLHELLPEPRVVEADRVHGEVEGVAGDLPEVGMDAHEAAQPGVFELLVAPQVGQCLARLPERASQARRRRMDVEQGSVGVEDAGADVADAGVAHLASPVPVDAVCRHHT